MKNKLQVGDLVLITGPSHYDKATVISVEKGRVTLDNQMVIDHTFNNLVKSQMTAEPWDENKFNYLRSYQVIPKIIRGLDRHWKTLSEGDTVALCSKLERVIDKFNINKF